MVDIPKQPEAGKLAPSISTQTPCGSKLMWAPGLPAMQTPRCSCHTEVMLSQASQLPHKPAHMCRPALFSRGLSRSRSRTP
ncbi:hypothetical protein CWC48_08720 [Pseudomonas sp. S10E 269]|nr:hypothetical protein CWC49_18880 [Pseudomonas sp. S09F 262]PJK39216.1 hypothetical protein CWC48_08720 [Pseudomonas sp. S10E 269]